MLGFYRKPPIVGRAISSKLLATPGSMLDWLPERTIYVSLSGWLEGVGASPPTFAMQDYLIHKTNSIPAQYAAKVGMVSDTLVFDFLVDGSCLSRSLEPRDS